MTIKRVTKWILNPEKSFTIRGNNPEFRARLYHRSSFVFVDVVRSPSNVFRAGLWEGSLPPPVVAAGAAVVVVVLVLGRGGRRSRGGEVSLLRIRTEKQNKLRCLADKSVLSERSEEDGQKRPGQKAKRTGEGQTRTARSWAQEGANICKQIQMS